MTAEYLIARRKRQLARGPRDLPQPNPILANIGRNHPHYGMTPTQHARTKAREYA